MILLSLALTNMTDPQLQIHKGISKILQYPGKWLKKPFSRPHSWSNSPQPSDSGHENRDGDISSVHHTIASSSVAHSIDFGVIGASNQRDQLSRSQPSSSGPSTAAVAHSQRKTPTQDGATSFRGTVKDYYAAVTLSFTTMLLRQW